ncbi:MAG: hypothetical protein H8E62_06160 [Planctomycetes bacterium]|nr:hypothetical protein [Planctomycetota bacterium]
MKKSCWILILVACAVMQMTLPSACAQLINEENACTWGISNNSLSIPSGSIITNAVLTLHNVSLIRNDPETALFIQLLDNPNLDLEEMADSQQGNTFEGYGALMYEAGVSDLSTTPQDIVIDLNQVDDDHSWAWNVFDAAPVITLADNTIIQFSSSLLTLLDYSGTGLAFGFGLDCDGVSVGAISLDLTIQSATESTSPGLLNFLVGNPNSAPVLDFIANQTVTETETLSFTVSATDADGDPLTYRALRLPAGADFTDQTFTWTPTNQQAQTYLLLFVVFDGNGGIDFQSMWITVNDLPQWTSLAYDDFEAGWGHYTAGGNDSSLYTDTDFAHQGNNAVNIQDNSDTESSFYLTDGIDISGYSEIKIEFWYLPVSMDNTSENFRLDYWNGSQWITLKTWVQGIDFQNDQFYFETIALSAEEYNFSTTMNIRFVCNASSNYDDIYIDEINILAK